MPWVRPPTVALGNPAIAPPLESVGVKAKARVEVKAKAKAGVKAGVTVPPILTLLLPPAPWG